MKKMLYGPVPSRRLGISLGVDIIPYKICSYDCIYCQLGKTTDQTLERKSYVNITSLLDELKETISLNSDIDYITFSGSGEPTLNKDIGQMIEEVKKFTQIRIAVLTNGSLLWDDKVRKDLSQADLVVPSLDAFTEEIFQKVNRPMKGLGIEKVLNGIKIFCEEFKGKIYLEIMLVKNINDFEEEIKKINQFVKNLRIDKIQLNTVIRPPGDPDAKPLNKEELIGVKTLFEPELKVELIADFKRETSRAYQKDLEQGIIELLKRRPTQKEEMAISLGIHPNEIVKYLQILEEKKIIRRSQTKDNSGVYFVIA
ncbi:MAG: radical SAM protein [candidate division Zixibacteria bacterium]|nr:radical SAM protein [candidate division Zixibacteria bacterium]